jgi:hypothetical protein
MNDKKTINGTMSVRSRMLWARPPRLQVPLIKRMKKTVDKVMV